jgi:hypothetical protein
MYIHAMAHVEAQLALIAVTRSDRDMIHGVLIGYIPCTHQELRVNICRKCLVARAHDAFHESPPLHGTSPEYMPL